MHVVAYGGAFDPLHNGHVDIVNHLCSSNEINKLCLIPTGNPVHKSATFFSPDVRISMLKCVFGTHPLIDILDIEIKKSQPSYTVDTINVLGDMYNATAMSLVVGVDQWFQFHRWRRFDYILSKCQLWVAPRDGISHESLMLAFPPELNAFKDKIHFLNVSPANVSSTRVRMMIKKKESLVGVVPERIIPLLEGGQ